VGENDVEITCPELNDQKMRVLASRGWTVAVCSGENSQHFEYPPGPPAPSPRVGLSEPAKKK
jgi:hypothetical protein